MSITTHELATATYGSETPVERPLCANCDCCLCDGPGICAVDAPGELFCRSCVTQCTTCSRFLHYTVNIPNASRPRGTAVGTCIECGDAPVPISIIRMQF